MKPKMYLILNKATRQKIDHSPTHLGANRVLPSQVQLKCVYNEVMPEFNPLTHKAAYQHEDDDVKGERHFFFQVVPLTEEEKEIRRQILAKGGQL